MKTNLREERIVIWESHDSLIVISRLTNIEHRLDIGIYEPFENHR